MVHYNNFIIIRYYLINLSILKILFDHTVAQTEVQCTIECHDQFYCENNFCKPRCDKFKSHSYTVATDVLLLASTCINIVTGFASLVISCLTYKRMYVADYHYYYDLLCTVKRF